VKYPDSLLFIAVVAAGEQWRSATGGMRMKAEPLIRRAAIEAQSMLDQLYAVAEPTPGSALDQAGLRDGRLVVEDYLSHNEAGVALEHLLYMIEEPPLAVSAGTRADVRNAAAMLGMTYLLANCAEAEPSAAPDGD
jgi:hypothetical protein